jgi:hypothetical protein
VNSARHSNRSSFRFKWWEQTPGTQKGYLT